jgi:hypothetical protein
VAINVKATAFRTGMRAPGGLGDHRSHPRTCRLPRARCRALELQNAVNGVKQRKPVLVRNDVRLVRKTVAAVSNEMPATALDFRGSLPVAMRRRLHHFAQTQHSRLLLTSVTMVFTHLGWLRRAVVIP